MGNALQKNPQIHPEQSFLLEEEEEYDNGVEFTCQICFEPAPNSDKRFRNGNKCSHPFCTDCVVKYIAARLDDGGSGEISCPGIGCDRSLEAAAFAATVGPDLFVRWCDALCEAAILGEERCYCPNTNCGAVIVNECGGIVRKSKCPNCGELFCFECKRFWHAGFGCNDAPRDTNDVALGWLVEEKKWMRCPRCRHFVERNEGCLFIDCRCGIIFCYKCGAQVTGHWCRCTTSSVLMRWCLIILRCYIAFALLKMIYRELFAEETPK